MRFSRVGRALFSLLLSSHHHVLSFLITIERANNFKKAVDPAVSRRRREETTIKLRKNKIQENLAKRRAEGNGTFHGQQQQQQYTPMPTLSQLPGFVRTLNDPNSDPKDLVMAARNIRRLTSVASNSPIEQLIQAGILPIMVRYLTYDQNTDVQYEAAWVLINIAATDEGTVDVVRAGAIPGAVRLLEACSPQLRDSASWLLGNIAGDSPALRDSVLQAGAMHSLLRNVQSPANPKLLQNVMWTISNLCRGKPSPDFNQVKDCIAAIPYAISHEHATDELLVDGLWTLSYLSDGDDCKIQAIIMNAPQTIPFAVQQLTRNKSSFMAPALRFLGNVVSGDEEQTQAVVDAGILQVISPCLHHPRKQIRKEATWLLSNIAAGSEDQVSALFCKPDIVELLVGMAASAVWDIRREGIYAVSNLASSGTPKQVAFLVDLDVIETLTDALDSTDSAAVVAALDGIEKILQVGSEYGRRRYDMILEEAGGIDKLEMLQHHTNDIIYEKAASILKNHFGGQDDEESEDENMAPATSGGVFEFGFGSPSNAFDFNSPSKLFFGSPPQGLSSPQFTSPSPKFDFTGFNTMNS